MSTWCRNGLKCCQMGGHCAEITQNGSKWVAMVTKRVESYTAIHQNWTENIKHKAMCGQGVVRGWVGLTPAIFGGQHRGKRAPSGVWRPENSHFGPTWSKKGICGSEAVKLFWKTVTKQLCVVRSCVLGLVCLTPATCGPTYWQKRVKMVKISPKQPKSGP